MLAHRIQRILRAGRVVATDLTVERADHRAIGLEQADQDVSHPHTPFKQRSRSACSSDDDAAPARGRARTTSTAALGSLIRCSRTRGRSRRFTRLRVTASPTALLTTNPTRAGEPDASSASSRWMTRVRLAARRPLRAAWRKTSASVSRWTAGSTGSDRHGRTGEQDLRPVSDGQALATLAAAARKDRPSGAGAHAQTEAVRLVTTAVVRLIRSLAHDTVPSLLRDPPGGSATALRSAGTARPRRTCVDMRHPSSDPGDRPTVRGGAQQGQTADHYRPAGQLAPTTTPRLPCG